MKNKLIFLVLFLPLFSSADTLQVIFRYYDLNGHLVAGSNLKTSSSSQVQRTINTAEDAWQEVQWIRQNVSDVLRFTCSSDSLDIRVEIHPKYQSTIKSIVIDRLQGGQALQVIKVNHLSCKFKGSIAMPLEYRFINPIDLKTLVPDSMSNYEKGLQVLSDSVMLLHCDKNQGVFIKYYLGINGTIELKPSPVECNSFKNESIRRLYNFIKKHPAFSFKIDNNYLIIKSGFEEIRLFIDA